MRSFSDDHGEGGVKWIIGETEIGIPDPKPPIPTITNTNGRTLTVEIPPIKNNKGPVSAVHVVVMFIDSDLSQQFEEDLLKGFKQATEDGLNYYITASLTNEVQFVDSMTS